MTTPATLIRKPDPDPDYTTALAREHLISLLNYCEEATGDERFYRYHEVGDQLRNYADAAGIKLDAPKGKARPVIEPVADTLEGDSE